MSCTAILNSGLFKPDELTLSAMVNTLSGNTIIYIKFRLLKQSEDSNQTSKCTMFSNMITKDPHKLK